MFVVEKRIVVVASRDVDLPYLEPLMKHLRSDVELEKIFTKEDFFAMPKADLGDLEAALKKDCPSPRSVWVFPGLSQAESTTRSPTCFPKTIHNFNVVIVFQCIRDTFTMVKDNDGVHLDGTFMELSEARKALKQSITRFNKNINQNPSIRYDFDFINWLSDEMLYPDDGNKLLISSSVFQTKIL